MSTETILMQNLRHENEQLHHRIAQLEEANRVLQDTLHEYEHQNQTLEQALTTMHQQSNDRANAHLRLAQRVYSLEARLTHAQPPGSVERTPADTHTEARDAATAAWQHSVLTSLQALLACQRAQRVGEGT